MSSCDELARIESEDPRISVLTVGDEILSGEITDSNFPVIAQALSQIGQKVAEHRTVEDDMELIARAIRSLASFSAAVIITGGLGPTSDDVTAAAVAKALHRDLVLHHETARRIESFFKRLNREMSEENLKQAFVPKGSTVIEPAGGTAPGFIVEHQDRIITALPGVPSEMKQMLFSHVIPYLEERFAKATIQKTRILRTFGSGESDVASMLRQIEAESRARFGYLATAGEILVKITASGDSEEEIEAILERESEKVKDRLGILVYGEGDDSMEAVLGRLLSEKGKTIAVAESCTGGMVASRITNIPGSSNYFIGGVVAYGIEAKRNLLKISDGILSKGLVSEEVAREMAKSARELFSADIGIGITGLAGPDSGGEKKQVGTVCIAISRHEGCESFEVLLPGNRMMVRNIATLAAMNIVRVYLLEIN